ncbi:MAG: hypothetical protein U1E28_00350 [Beijerinckiaceae bacterium]
MFNRTFTFLLAAGLAAAPTLAHAESRAIEQTRMVDGTIGAVAGALIGGPIGLLIGGALGYTMGPEVTGPMKGAGQPVRVAKKRTVRKRPPAAPAAYQQAALPPGYPQYLAYPGAAYPGMPQQYPMQGYPQQPGQPAVQQRPAFNPARNALVPAPDMVAPSQPYAAVVTAPQAPVAYPPGARPPAGYAPQGYPQAAPVIRAAPVPLPR